MSRKSDFELPKVNLRFKKNPKVQKSSIIMAVEYGHESKDFEPVFVGAYSPDFVLVRSDLKISPTHFISTINLK